jgi:hypothetical protein
MVSGNNKRVLRWSHDGAGWRFVYIRDGRRFLSEVYKTCHGCFGWSWLVLDSNICPGCYREEWRNERNRRFPHLLIQSRAHALVSKAVRAGSLADLRAVEVRCSDCSARAACYDHRDYRKPLDVQPVCTRCNKRRGPAIDIAHLVTRRLKRRAASNN